MSFGGGSGFDIGNVFGEGKTNAPKEREPKKKGRKSRKNERRNQKDQNDSFTKMQDDSVIQSQSMGIDQPKQSLGIPTFDDIGNMSNNPKNPLNKGLTLDAGFKQPTPVQQHQKRNPLNVGLQVGNLGIDSFDTKKSAFSGDTIDVGFGATPKPRSALAGASNLGGDFIARTRGSERTGLHGGGEQDFLRVSGKSFAGVPQILPSGVDQSPTPQGARNRAIAQQRQAQGQQPESFNALKGIESLAGQIGRTSSAITLRDGKSKLERHKQRQVRGQIGNVLGKGTGKHQTDFNPFNIRGRRRVNEREQEQIDDLAEPNFDDLSQEERARETNQRQRQRDQDFEEEFEQTKEGGRQRRKQAREQSRRDQEQAQRDDDFEEASQGFSDEVIKQKIIRKRGLTNRRSSVAIPEFIGTIPVKETRKQREQRLRNEVPRPDVIAGQRLPSNIVAVRPKKKVHVLKPISTQFDTDGDGEVDSIGSTGAFHGKATSHKKGAFGTPPQVTKKVSEVGNFGVSDIYIKKKRPNLTLQEFGVASSELKDGETLNSLVSDQEFLQSGLDNGLPPKVQRQFDIKYNKALKRSQGDK